jgi:hypothetical protein
LQKADEGEAADDSVEKEKPKKTKPRPKVYISQFRVCTKNAHDACFQKAKDEDEEMNGAEDVVEEKPKKKAAAPKKAPAGEKKVAEKKAPAKKRAPKKVCFPLS